jgi:hypothetical protein
VRLRAPLNLIVLREASAAPAADLVTAHVKSRHLLLLTSVRPDGRENSHVSAEPDCLPQEETVETLYRRGEQDRIDGISGYVATLETQLVQNRLFIPGLSLPPSNACSIELP